MEIRHLEEVALTPHIVFCNNYIDGMNLPIGYQLDSRYIYDYEIELVTDCNKGYMIQNGKKIMIKQGDIFFRRPGETTRGVMQYSSYVCCFEHKKTGRKFSGGYDVMKPKTFLTPIHHALIDDLPSQFHTSSYNRYLNQFKDLLNCYITPHKGSEVYMSSLIIQILYQLNQEINEVVDHRHKRASTIKEVIRYINQHYEEDLDLAKLSDVAHLSPTYFHQVFKKIVGQSPQAFLTEKRVNSAKEMLIHSNDSVKSIAYKTGFKDSSYFCYAFKRETGLSPQKYREANQITYMNT